MAVPMAMKAVRAQRNRGLDFRPLPKARTSKRVKNPYRGICRRLKGFKTLIWDTMGEPAQEKIKKMQRAEGMKKKEVIVSDLRLPQTADLHPDRFLLSTRRLNPTIAIHFPLKGKLG